MVDPLLQSASLRLSLDESFRVSLLGLLSKVFASATNTSSYASPNATDHPATPTAWSSRPQLRCGCHPHHVGCPSTAPPPPPPTAPPLVPVYVPPTAPPRPADPYNCADGFANWQAGWSVGKKAWCCKVHGKGCPGAAGGCETSAPYDCNAGFANWVVGWSVGKKAWCCAHGGKGCPGATSGCA